MKQKIELIRSAASLVAKRQTALTLIDSLILPISVERQHSADRSFITVVVSCNLRSVFDRWCVGWVRGCDTSDAIAMDLSYLNSRYTLTLSPNGRQCAHAHNTKIVGKRTGTFDRSTERSADISTTNQIHAVFMRFLYAAHTSLWICYVISE